jgi:hypothetical protein
LNKLRELVAYLLRDRKCCFCHGLLTDHAGATDGDERGRPITDRITIHHRNGKHHDKRGANERLAHQSCHKSFQCQEPRPLEALIDAKQKKRPVPIKPAAKEPGPDILSQLEAALRAAKKKAV